MQITVRFDQSIASLPAGFVTAVNYVASYFDSLFTNSVNLTIVVGYGEIAGQSLASGALGESLPALNGQAGYVPIEPYASVRNALLAENAPGANTLPVGAPANAPGELVTTQAEAKALGLIANNGGVDGYVGFDAAPGVFDYSTTGTSSNEYDFVAAVEHEFSEIMGRISGLDTSASYTPMDLYRFSGANTRQFTTGATSYFSINNGVSDLDNWNNFQTGNSGDLGDWAPTAGNDSFDDMENQGAFDTLTSTDITLMGALGWTSAPTLQMTLSSDVFWVNGDGTLAAWTPSGFQQVTFQGVTAMPDASWSATGVGDFNGDGKSDILWRNTNGTLVDWTMNGSQILASQQITIGGYVASPDESWSIAGIGDFNGDGKSDILWRNANGALIDWTMNGSQITANQSLTLQGGLVSPDVSWNVAGVGDFNGDGKSDILWRNTSGALIEWSMNGSQITSSRQVTLGASAVAPDSSWSIAGVGDFNGDGKSDILWRNTSGNLIDWTMNGSQVAAIQQVTLQGTPALPDSSWQIAQIGDFNSNGKSDILWRNSDGALAEWTMNGAQITASQGTTLQLTSSSNWNPLAKPTDFI
ncbi:MAG: VCBS repeat-containing protein [Hyphomicrobiales bacterium]|nr:VCBS repeat-containing protein [Hyphomicrobiales bacterium]